jgi:UDP-N-acetylmuramate dehydrogenase
MVVAAQGARACPTDGGFILHVNAGEVLDSLIEETVKRRWSGLELLSGIPGLVGAAPIQNVGAYGAEVSSAILSVTAYDRSQQEVVTLENQQCHFGYRTSLFKENPGRYVVLSVDFFVSHDPFSSPINYTDVATLLHLDMGERVPLAQAREAVLAVRASKGTLLNVNDHDTWSAGSFFTNPLITTEISDQLPKEAPRFPQEDGTIKTSAAWLIEHAGFEKGYGTQEATLSTKHVLALTNRGGATTSEIIALGREIQQGVQKKYGITLTPEPTLVGMPW